MLKVEVLSRFFTVLLACHLFFGLSSVDGQTFIDDMLRFLNIQSIADLPFAEDRSQTTNSYTINFYLYNKNQNSYASLSATCGVSSFGLNTALETIVIIHGFNDNFNPSSSNSWQNTMKNAIFSNVGNMNVIAVDWSAGASLIPVGYPQAAENTKETGRRVANLLRSCPGINLNNVICVGHSLGAQTCGFVGKNLKNSNGSPQLGRIAGLDPAGPLFNLFQNDATKRLDKTDATKVDVIHTDPFYGMPFAIGHKDFYPNNQQVQPGCNTFLDKDGCSHFRAFIYFTESFQDSWLYSLQCVSKKCSDWNTYVNGGCNGPWWAPTPNYKMGYFAWQSGDYGKFYNTPKSNPDYCRLN